MNWGVFFQLLGIFAGASVVAGLIAGFIVWAEDRTRLGWWSLVIVLATLFLSIATFAGLTA